MPVTCDVCGEQYNPLIGSPGGYNGHSCPGPPLPEPAPEIIMAANGVYWRRYPGHLSMVPVSDDNDPVIGPLAVYKLVGYEDHEGVLREVGE